MSPDLSNILLPNATSFATESNSSNQVHENHTNDTTTKPNVHIRLDNNATSNFPPPRRRMIMPTLLPPSPITEEGHQYFVKVKDENDSSRTRKTVTHDYLNNNNDIGIDNSNLTTTMNTISMDDNEHTILAQKERRRNSNHNRHHSDPDTFAIFTDNPNATYGRTDSYCFLEALGEISTSSSGDTDVDNVQLQQQQEPTSTTLNNNTSISCGQENPATQKNADTPIGLAFADQGDETNELSSSSFSSQRLNEMEVQHLSHPLAF
mmetsp:Transcript_9313/g.13253  ORF Transcript_9313/g.13253 Transcript_9313/m.13253 type:complete len:264 (+) Transcript_9313:319-1110(+)